MVDKAGQSDAMRRAAEEAAKIAARRAAEKAARETARKNAERMQQKQVAEAQKKAAPAAADQAEGLLSKLVGGAKDVAEGIGAAAQQAHDKKVADARQAVAKLEGAFARAERPADVERLAGDARALAEGAGADESLPEGLRGEIARLSARAEKANKAVEELEGARKVLDGTPEERAGATARLLARGEEVHANMAGLAALKGSPLAARAREELPKLAEAATPERLAKALAKAPDLTGYAPEAAGDLARLRGLDAGLDRALDRSAGALLDQGLSLDAVKANPGLAQVLAGSQDPAIRARAGEAAKAWAKESLAGSLEGKEGEDGVKEAMEAFKAEMADLAGKTGLGEVLQTGALAAAEEGQDQIEEVAKKGQGLFDKITGALGDIVGDVGGFLGDIAKPVQGALDGAFGGIGDVVKKGVGFAGVALDAGIEGLAKINPVNLGLKGLSAGLDAVGLEGAADLAAKGSRAIEKGADVLGDQVENFTKGAADAFGGTIQGLGSIIAHPVQTVSSMAYLATHPQALGEVGKALWKEGTKHGVAGAIGYIAGNAAPMLLSGGAAGGALASKGAALAGSSSRLAQGAGVAMRVVGSGLQTGTKVMEATRLARTAKFGEAFKTIMKPADEVLANVKKGAVLGFRDQARVMRQGLAELRPGRGPTTLKAAGEVLAPAETSNKVAAKVVAEEGIKAAPKQRLKESLQAVFDRSTGKSETADVVGGQAEELHLALRAKKGYRAIDGGAKLGAHGIRAVTDPARYLMRQADKAIERVVNPEIYAKLKGTVPVDDLADEATRARLLERGLDASEGLRLTAGRQVVHDSFGRLNTQVASTEAYQRYREEANTAIKEQVLASLSWLS